GPQKPSRSPRLLRNVAGQARTSEMSLGGAPLGRASGQKVALGPLPLAGWGPRVGPTIMPSMSPQPILRKPILRKRPLHPSYYLDYSRLLRPRPPFRLIAFFSITDFLNASPLEQLLTKPQANHLYDPLRLASLLT